MSNWRELVARRLRDRRSEIEQAMLCRVRGIADPTREDAGSYEDRLRQAVSEAFDHAVEVLGSEGDFARTPPASLLAQARLAARRHIPLDVILRRYFAAFARFSHFVLEEAEEVDEAEAQGKGGFVQTLFQAQALEFDRVIEQVTVEYRGELDRRRTSTIHRHTDRIKRLLAGEPVTGSSFDYELKGWHIGLIIGGDLPDGALRSIAESLNLRLLRAQPETCLTWVWFGGRRRLDTTELLKVTQHRAGSSQRIAIGEPGLGLTGWRLSHWQAAAAFRHADQDRRHVVRYADIALAACVQQDHVLAATLQQLFLDPLKNEKDGGKALRQTLRAYLSSGRNMSSAAAMLGVSRQTVASRLRSSEEKLGRSLEAYGTEIEVALRIADLDEPASTKLGISELLSA